MNLFPLNRSARQHAPGAAQGRSSQWLLSLSGCRLVFLGTLIVASAGCCVTAPHRQQIETIHTRGDIAVNSEQARVRVRSLVQPLCGTIVEGADRILAESTNRVVRRQALLWKIEGVPAMREALFLPNPLLSVSDAWVLARQMADYFEKGAGREALGEASAIALATCEALEDELQKVAVSLTESGDVRDVQQFVQRWAAEHPMRHSIAGRESLQTRALEQELSATFSAGEVAAQLAVTVEDVTRRMDAYSAQLPDQARWQAELFAMDLAEDYRLEEALPLAQTAVQSATEAVATVKQFAPPVHEALAVAKTAPEFISQERAAVIKVAHDEISRSLEAIQTERIAALQHITKEREAALLELHRLITEERKLLTTDIEQISLKALDHAFLRAAQLVGAVLVVVFIGAVLLLFITRAVFFGKRTTGSIAATT